MYAYNLLKQHLNGNLRYHELHTRLVAYFKEKQNLGDERFKKNEINEILLKLYGNNCVFCKKPMSEKQMSWFSDPDLRTIEHILPKKWGGVNRIENLCFSCQECNSIKGNSLAIYYNPNTKQRFTSKFKYLKSINNDLES